jgi:hypothetical protein
MKKKIKPKGKQKEVDSRKREGKKQKQLKCQKDILLKKETSPRGQITVIERNG